MKSSRTTWCLLAVVCLAGFYAGWASYRACVDGHSDLIDFHQTSLYWWRTGEFSRDFGVRHYLQVFVILIAPLTAWPLELVAPLFTLLSFGLLLLTLRACGRVIAGSPRESPPFSVRWVWPLVLVLPYAHSTLGLGQVNVIVLFLCTLALIGLGRGRDLLAGLLVAVAGVIKIYPLLLIGFFLVRGRWRAGLSTVVCFVLLTVGLSLAGFGWQGSKAARRIWLAEVRGEQYRKEGEPAGFLPRHLMFLPERNHFLRHNNQSLAAVVRRLTSDLGPPVERDRPVHVMNLSHVGSRVVYLTLTGGVLVLLVASTWRERRSDDAFVVLRLGSAWLAASIAFIPIYWTHYFVLNLPMLALLTAEVWSRRKQHRRWSAAEILFILWLAAIPLIGVIGLRLVGFHCWLALATIVWTVASRGKAEIPPQSTSIPEQ